VIDASDGRMLMQWLRDIGVNGNEYWQQRRSTAFPRTTRPSYAFFVM
jgi:hypothetical protein